MGPSVSMNVGPMENLQKANVSSPKALFSSEK